MGNVWNSYEQFELAVKEYFQRMYADGRVEICSVSKNNGVEKKCLTILKKGEQVSPAIYLEAYYQSYQKDFDLQRICTQIEEYYRSRCAQQTFKTELLFDFEAVKEHLRILLINFTQNREVLGQMPYLRVLDLALICYIGISMSKDEEAVLWVYDSCRERWTVSEKEMFDKALRNSVRDMPYRLLVMPWLKCVLPEEAQTEEPLFPEGLMGESFEKMFVLTNKCRKHGAAALCYPNVLSECAKYLEGDIYVLPSSIHEMVLFAASYENEEYLRDMVREVNDEHVDTEEILSYHVYRYDHEEMRLEDLVTKRSVLLSEIWDGNE